MFEINIFQSLTIRVLLKAITNTSKGGPLLLAALLMLSGFSLRAETQLIFEGYYRVLLSGQHSGYVIQRYEHDKKAKQFVSTSYTFVRLSPDGKLFLSESLTSNATEGFVPVSYNYSGLIADNDPKTNQIQNKITTIDATFRATGGAINGTLKGFRNGKKFTERLVLQKGTFLSSFLIYLMLEKGLAPGKKYNFEAVAEESGSLAKGRVDVKQETQMNGIEAHRVEWSFKDLSSVSFISTKGEALSTESPAQNVKQELVLNREAAVGTLTFAEKSIRELFKGLPSGEKNSLVEKVKARKEGTNKNEK